MDSERNISFLHAEREASAHTRDRTLAQEVNQRRPVLSDSRLSKHACSVHAVDGRSCNGSLSDYGEVESRSGERRIGSNSALCQTRTWRRRKATLRTTAEGTKGGVCQGKKEGRYLHSGGGTQSYHMLDAATLRITIIVSPCGHRQISCLA